MLTNNQLLLKLETWKGKEKWSYVSSCLQEVLTVINDESVFDIDVMVQYLLYYSVLSFVLFLDGCIQGSFGRLSVSVRYVAKDFLSKG